MARYWNARLAVVVVAATALGGCEDFAALVETPEAQSPAAVPAAARQTQQASAGTAAPAPQQAQFVPRSDGGSGFSRSSGSSESAGSSGSSDPGGFGGGFDSPDAGDDNDDSTSWN
jgi:uncharacterized membrane protein YgcG